MWRNWGVRWPIRRVKFAIEHRREGRSGLKAAAVFRFLSEDWSPWSALARMRERWPDLRHVESGVSPANEADFTVTGYQSFTRTPCECLIAQGSASRKVLVTLARSLLD